MRLMFMKTGFAFRKIPYDGPVFQGQIHGERLFRGAKPELTGASPVHGSGVPKAVPRSYTAIVLHPRGSCVPSPCRIAGLGFL